LSFSAPFRLLLLQLRRHFSRRLKISKLERDCLIHVAIPLAPSRRTVHVDVNDFASDHLEHHLNPVFGASASAAYSSGLCFPKERDATKNADTLGVLAKNRSVIYRADGLLWVDVLEPAKAEA
jgi:hypothetical protein